MNCPAGHGPLPGGRREEGGGRRGRMSLMCIKYNTNVELIEAEDLDMNTSKDSKIVMVLDISWIHL